MISKEPHSKHVKLARPSLGNYSRNELAIIGAPCSEIQALAKTIIDQLGSEYNIAFVDADHGADESASMVGAAEFTDKITHRRLELAGDPNEYQRRVLFNDLDLVLVNGNHFEAAHQIVIVHPKKEESLSRKLDRLTAVELILMSDDETGVFDYLEPHIAPDTPIAKLCEDKVIVNWLKYWLAARKPALNGLVLSGGKSQRLGRDKTILNYHGVPQREYAVSRLQEVCEKVFVSVREDHSEESHETLNFLNDNFLGLGPLGGILSAFRSNPESAWFALASDLPFAGSEAIAYLVEHRNPSKLATAFLNPATGFPDPLMTIWEPRAYHVLLSFLAQGYSCPRKVLINSEIELVDLPEPKWLMNVNTPQDLEKVRSLL